MIDRNEAPEETTPMSLIDVSFLLLLFFCVVAAVVTTKGSGDRQTLGTDVGEGLSTVTTDSMPLPAAYAEDDETRMTTDVTVLIRRQGGNRQVFEFYLLGWDSVRAAEDTSFTERDLEAVRAWSDTVRDRDGVVTSVVYRYGHVLPSFAPRDTARERVGDFFAYLRTRNRFRAVRPTVAIKADSAVGIGFISEVLKTCGRDSISEVLFLVRPQHARLVGVQSPRS